MPTQSERPWFETCDECGESLEDCECDPDPSDTLEGFSVELEDDFNGDSY